MKKIIRNIRALISPLADATVLLPLLLMILLGIIWNGTYLLIKVERANAQSHAASFSLEQLHTYEAQVVRVLHEIDQSLKTIKYAYESGIHDDVLNTLNNKGLLPPVILFSVGIIDTSGKVTSSIGWENPTSLTLDSASLQQLQQVDTLVILQLPELQKTEGSPLLLARRLNTANGSFAGVVAIKVDASYFVSSYENSTLGAEGLMGLFTSDGKFLALRLGETISYGANADYAEKIAENPDEVIQFDSNSLDGIQRHTVARQLYAYPLAVVVGISQREQLAKAQRQIDEYVLQALLASIALVVFVAILFYGNRQLNLSRRRERESAITYAAQVEHLAYHDTLTGLPNRGLFGKLVQQQLTQALRHNQSLALLFLDLDRFKYINDTLGHDIGDQLLIQVAQRLRDCLRRSDVVARIGGDEFVVLISDEAMSNYASVVAEKILLAVAQPFKVLQHEFWITVSIGISTFPQDGEDEQTLMKNADTAMYQAKASGKNNFKFYSSELSQPLIDRMNLEADLSHALQRKEFVLHYQCRFNRDGTISGVEALLRWQHPRLGILAPMQFLDMAEKMRLTIALGKWVTTCACTQLREWQNRGFTRCKMAVNLTACQFEDTDLLQDLQEILAVTDIDAGLLELEIPQAVLLHDLDFSQQRLLALKTLGVKIVVDDFGAEYSSLASLKTLPLDAISMPRSFLAGSAYQDSHLTAAVIALGKTLGLSVVAKGVENHAQAQFMQKQSCDELQGFYFNKPMEAQNIETLLQSSAPLFQLNDT